ncbi:bacteriocin immunity protein [Latilactobacillus fuchuensis]|uniref:bacteriocin immunity protein n=1 Tax=Latilactobacillus fuchuensis TaxID=164393 RepID=UPI0020C7B30F|nr:bacteriocin immunity protein [Latilactobacillus fuchuensis]MCP8857633.1 bacteriocin immunity protein [Latilactobacillus fuchuensis]
MKNNKEKDIRNKTKCYVKELYGLLLNRDNQSSELLDITDVLLQVYKKIDEVKNPEALVNRLVNYIRVVASTGQVYFPTDQEKLLIELSVIGQKAGLNGLCMADFSDKSQFYSIFEEIPKRN